ncbi:MAG: sulfatase-like hydrolase/transferase [Alphaproteobacteria bacterium]|nr:sulfatase-like hydrolase/transferase [Alphaproteobacteria bacterium]
MRWLPVTLAVLIGAACDGDAPIDTPTDDTPDDTDVVQLPNHAPGATGLVMSPATGHTWMPLTCLVIEPSTDPDGDPVTYVFSWLRDGVPYDGPVAMQAREGDTIPASEVRPGQVWTCQATPTDDGGLAGPTALVAARVVQPNILVMVADDLGYGDVGAFGGTDIDTPSLDALAAGGMTFDAAYVTGVTCTPSRAGILTGRRPTRYGVEFNLGAPVLAEAEGRGLPFSEVTIADVLRDAGLQTGLIGKWHLGLMPQHHPLARGFQGYLGFLAGQRNSLEPGLPGEIEAWPFLSSPPGWPFDHWSEALQFNGEQVEVDPQEHLTDRIGREASAFVGTQAQSPFFLMVTWQAPHEPVQASPAMLDRIDPHPADPETWAYRATVAGLDLAVGRLLTRLESAGFADDTLVVFLSDHGCTDVFGWCSNAPFRGGKITMMEGGIRTPMIVRWPGRVPAGATFTAPVSTLDLFPTLAAAAGAAVPERLDLDGVDLLPWIVGDQTGPVHDVLDWRVGDVRAIRDGDDKLVDVQGHTYLFDLAADPGETTNLATQRPGLVNALRAELDAVQADDVDPLWAPRSADLTYYGDPYTVPF